MKSITVMLIHQKRSMKRNSGGLIVNKITFLTTDGSFNWTNKHLP